MDYFSDWKEKIRDKIAALLVYFTEKPQQRIQEPESQPQPRQEEQSLGYRLMVESNNYTPEQIENFKQIEQLTTDQILQQHPHAMDYSHGRSSREVVAEFIKAKMLEAILAEPLLSKRRAERGEPSPERKREVRQLRQKMLENKYQKERDIKKKEISKRKRYQKVKRYSKISDK